MKKHTKFPALERIKNQRNPHYTENMRPFVPAAVLSTPFQLKRKETFLINQARYDAIKEKKKLASKFETGFSAPIPIDAPTHMCEPNILDDNKEKRLFYKKVTMDSLLKTIEEKTYKSKNIFIDFPKFLSLFTTYFEEIIDLLPSNPKRLFIDKISQQQKFVFKEILYLFKVTDNIVQIWQDINNSQEYNEEVYLSCFFPIHDIVRLHNNTIMKLQYYAPIITTTNYLKIHFDFIDTLMDNQIRLLKPCEKIITISNWFDYRPDILNQFSKFYMVSIHIEDLINRYQSEHNQYIEEKTPQNIEKFLYICLLKQKYSQINNELCENKSMPESFADAVKKDISFAQLINYFLSICMIDTYFRYKADIIKKQYTQLSETTTFPEFISQINLFIKEITHTMSYLNHTSENDNIFIEQYNKIIFVENHLVEILVSAQEIYYITSLFIKMYSNTSEYLSITIDLQKEQIELLKTTKSILDFLMTSMYYHNIPKWCYLENDTIITRDIIAENTQKISPTADIVKKSGIFSGFSITELLTIKNQLIESLSANCKIRSLEYPEAISYEDIIDEENMVYKKLIEEEEKHSKKYKEKKTHSIKKQSFLQKKSKKSPPLDTKHIPEKKTIPASENKKEFQRIQEILQHFKNTKNDNILKNEFYTLLKTIKDPKHIVQIYDFFATQLYIHGKRLSKKNILDMNAIVHFNLALYFKKISQNKFKQLETNESSVIHQHFFQDEISQIETILDKTKADQQKKLNTMLNRLREIDEGRLQAIEKLGFENFYNNPNPKNIYAAERKTLQLGINHLRQLEKEINDTTLLLESFQINKKSERISRNDPVLEQKILSLNDKISFNLTLFEKEIQDRVKTRLQLHSIDKKPNLFFPHTLLQSTLKFMAYVKNCTRNGSHIYLTGGFLLNLLQEKSIATQPFHFIDIDLVTNADYREILNILKNVGISYRTTAFNEKFVAFKLYFEKVNMDLVCNTHLDLQHDQEKRHLNITALYLGIDDELCPFFIDNNDLISRIIDINLLNINIPQLIKTGSIHLENIDILKIMPKWNEVCQWVSHHFPFLSKKDSVSILHTVKSFIDDPVRLLQIILMARKGMLQFTNCDVGIQLCFNHSDKNFLLSLILEAHFLLKNTTPNYTIIFDKYMRHVIKKASQGLDYATNFSNISLPQLTNIFYEAMAWYFSEKYFLEIFILPMKMQTSLEYHPTLEKTCQRLFSHNEKNGPVYHFLKKELMEMYLSPFKQPVEVRMLPFILAWVITIHGRMDVINSLDEAIKYMSKIMNTVPDFNSGLSSLYPELSSRNVSLPVKNYLTKCIATINKNPEWFNNEEKEKEKEKKHEKISFFAGKQRFKNNIIQFTQDDIKINYIPKSGLRFQN